MAGRRIARRLLFTLLALCLTEPLALAADRDWRVMITPYGWLAGSRGTVVTGGKETEIDVPFNDFADNTKAGFQLYVEARRGRWFGGFDGTWATLAGEEVGNIIAVDVEIVQRIYDFRAGYEIYRRTRERVRGREDALFVKRTVVDVFVGGRYFKTEPTLTVNLPGGGEVRSTSSDTRVDPFLGLRVGHDVSPRWGLGLRGDIGGFGIGDAAQFSWQAEATVAFQLSSVTSLLAGYRLLSFDTITGTFLERNGQDLLQQGPVIGAAFRF